MDNSEAAALLNAVMQAYEALSYRDLQNRIDEVDARQLQGRSGTEYTAEIEVKWEGSEGGPVKIIGSIDDGRFFSALKPFTHAFVVTRDGDNLKE